MKRKIHEAFLALWIEARLTKDEILKLYLDRSYLGGGTYGVEAAAQYYFGKSIRDVNLSEAAMLAGLFKAPSKYAPHVNAEAAQARANIVLYRMLDVALHHARASYLKARREPARVVRKDIFDSPDWFLDWAYRGHARRPRRAAHHRRLCDRGQDDDRSPHPAQRPSRSSTRRSTSRRRPINATQAAVVTMDAGRRRQGDRRRAQLRGKQVQPRHRCRCASRARRSSPSSIWRRFMNGFTPNHGRRRAGLGRRLVAQELHPEICRAHHADQRAGAFLQSHAGADLMIQIGRKAISRPPMHAGIQTELENWAPTVLGASAVTAARSHHRLCHLRRRRHARDALYACSRSSRPNGDMLYDRVQCGAAAQRRPCRKRRSPNSTRC